MNNDIYCAYCGNVCDPEAVYVWSDWYFPYCSESCAELDGALDGEEESDD